MPVTMPRAFANSGVLVLAIGFVPTVTLSTSATQQAVADGCTAYAEPATRALRSDVFSAKDLEELEVHVANGRGVPTFAPTKLPLGDSSIFRVR